MNGATNSARFWVVLGWMLALSGCGQRSTASVSGKVTFQGQPIVFGSIAFLHEDGRLVSGLIRGGQFSIDGVPLGDLKVAVQARDVPAGFVDPRNPSAAKIPESAQQPLKIPEALEDPNRSGLSVTVSAPVETKDFELPLPEELPAG